MYFLDMTFPREMLLENEEKVVKLDGKLTEQQPSNDGHDTEFWSAKEIESEGVNKNLKRIDSKDIKFDAEVAIDSDNEVEAEDKDTSIQVNEIPTQLENKS